MGVSFIGVVEVKMVVVVVMVRNVFVKSIVVN
jgi:hypothetical protein